MLILLEGVDGGGKSTLADRIAETFTFLTEDDPNPPQVVRIHKGKPTPNLDAFQEYELPLERFDLRDLVTSKRDLVIMDRWHAGEQPYGTIYRGNSRLDDAGLLHVELTLSSYGAVKVLAQPSDVELIKFRLRERGEDFLQPEHVDQVWRWYETLKKRYGYVRASDTAPSELLQTAKERALGDEPPVPQRWPGYIGSHHPRTILVGDQRNDGPRARHEFVRAFTPCLNGSSAHYLLQTLIRADMHRDFGIVNAHESGVDLSLIPKIESSPTVVALGRLASKSLTDLGIEHETVPHPQWVRRFRSKQMGWYASEIRKAAEWK
jgi:Thymidylate kinase